MKIIYKITCYTALLTKLLLLGIITTFVFIFTAIEELEDWSYLKPLQKCKNQK